MYKEEELGLNDEGGGERLNDEGGGERLNFTAFLLFMAIFKLDTPLCPFDCNCCKFF